MYTLKRETYIYNSQCPLFFVSMCSRININIILIIRTKRVIRKRFHFVILPALHT